MLPNQNNYIPSFDFGIFELPNFSPLQANEFGAFTEFSANTPTSFVDFSLNRLLGILSTPNDQPFPIRPYTNDYELENMFTFFQSQEDRETLPALRDRLRRVRDEAQRKLEEIGDTQVPFKKPQDTNVQVETDLNCLVRNPFTGKCLWSVGYGKAAREAAKKLPDVSTAESIAGSGEPIGDKSSKSIAEFFKMLPEGTGIFLLALVALIFLFLFVRK